MNHTSNLISVGTFVAVQEELLSQNLSSGLAMFLGEMNSLYNEGAPGLSNSFGAALWGIDFNLLCAANNITRTHMHQGTNYRYASWQPVQTNDTTIGTKPPYYGNVFVAAMLAGGSDAVQVVNLPLPQEEEAAYAAYVNGRLARIAVINMQGFNYTDSESTAARPSSTYSFQVPTITSGGYLSVQRLLANGSNALSGITWDGWSYNYELDQGRPVLLHNVTIGERLAVGPAGELSIDVPYSSAAIINIHV